MTFSLIYLFTNTNKLHASLISDSSRSGLHYGCKFQCDVTRVKSPHLTQSRPSHHWLIEFSSVFTLRSSDVFLMHDFISDGKSCWFFFLVMRRYVWVKVWVWVFPKFCFTFSLFKNTVSLLLGKDCDYYCFVEEKNQTGLCRIVAVLC